MNDRHRLDQLFAEALQTPPAMRHGFVDRACGPDAALRDELLSLLVAADDSRHFMTTSALEDLAADVARDGWAVRPGDRVGAYAILRLLGSGGAGQVWCARDERLGRDVAIKMLLPFLASDPARIRRFADEARLAGTLNHPNVLAVYDVGEHGGAPFLVSEYLDGETLRARLEQGPLSVEKAVAVAAQIAGGLSAAHARGIVHRDLKPENVFLKSDGGVKILDFGVAKLLPSEDSRSGDPSHTIAGAIVGTAGYMAPEQITGARLDVRADLFALGAIMYEMLGGLRPFKGSSTFETLQAILIADPPTISTVNPKVTPAVAAIVQRLLEKVPESRFQSAADLAWALDRALPTSTDGRNEAPARTRSWKSIGAQGITWTAAVLALVLFAAWGLGRSGPPARGVGEPTRFTWSLPAGISLDSAPVVSPVGRRLALVGHDRPGMRRIFVRDLGELEASALPGTEGAKQPFWSPDGRSIGFFANGKLITVALEGGAPVVVCDAPDARGGSWSPNGTIVFQAETRDTGLSRVAVNGGRVEPATILDVTGPDVAHRWPVFLPDGDHFLYFVVSTNDERRGVYLANIASKASEPGTLLFRSSSGPVYVPSAENATGMLLSAESRWIEARSFDTARLVVSAEVQKIDVPAMSAGPHHSALLGASADILTFASSPIPYGAHVASINSDGADLQIRSARELGGFLRLSPDGRRLARIRVDPIRSDPDVWVDDLTRGGQLRITTTRDLDVLPVWSPDGARIAYRSGTNAAPTLRISAADGTGATTTVQCPRPYCEPTDWSPDDTLIVNVSGGDVWSVPTDARGEPRPILHASFVERDARVSPDGRWIAYVSNESGRAEVSVRSLSGPERRLVASTEGGDQPVWRRDGAELFYVNPHGLLHGVSVRRLNGGHLSFGVPRRLMVPPFAERHWGTVYDVSADGQRVYFPHPGEEPSPSEIGVVLGWRALFK